MNATETRVPSGCRDIDSLVAEVADRFTEEVKQGGAPSVEAYAQRHPEIATIIRQVFPALAVLGDLSSSSSIEHPASSIDPAQFDGLAVGPSVGLLGDFRILREIGRGGMGVVYEAEQISLGRGVALKVLPFAAMLDKQQLARFKNEARAAATLDHPNIVAVHSIGVERSVHFYAMQLIEGQSLAQVVEQLRHSHLPLPPGEGQGEGKFGGDERGATSEKQVGSPPLHGEGLGEGCINTAPIAALPTLHAPSSSLPAYSSRDYFRTVAQLGIQAAEALDHAHQNGILHRDIKPANLLLECQTPSPLRGGLGRGCSDASHLKLWITDFGLARMEQDAGMTMTGDVLGTLRYMSPEQALAKRVVVDHRSDIYSLGVTLYELLALQPAFPATDRQELLRQIAFDEPRTLRKLDGRIPIDLETIILKATAKERDDRYQSAGDLADDLGAFCERRPINARPRSLADRARKWLRRHLILVSVAGVAALLLCSILVISIVLVKQAQSRTALARAEMSALRHWTENALSLQKKAWNEDVQSIRDRNRSAIGRVDQWPQAFADSPGFLANPRSNQRWRLVPSGSKDEYQIEWRDPGTQTWSGRVLELVANDGVVLRPSTNSSSQRWRITDGRDPRLFVNISSGLVLDYYGRGERQFQADVSMQVGATGKYGQLWIILVTPNKGEVGLFNVHAKRYLGYDSVANIVSCEE